MFCTFQIVVEIVCNAWFVVYLKLWLRLSNVDLYTSDCGGGCEQCFCIFQIVVDAVSAVGLYISDCHGGAGQKPARSLQFQGSG